MWGWNPQKPTKLNGNDTILSYHPYNLCHFANCTPQNSLHALSLFILNEQGTQLCSLHSLHIKDNPYLPCSAPIKISQHDLLTLIYHTDPALLMHYTVSAYKQDRPYLQCLVQQLHFSHLQNNPLPMHINMHYTPTTTHPTAFHNPFLYTTNKHKASLCKWQQIGTRCRDGVKVLWCHSHLGWLVFEGSIPTRACFPSENLFVTC